MPTSGRLLSFQMLQRILSGCLTGALSDVPAATCLGGWYQPFALKGYWSDTTKPANDKFFKCFHGKCDAGRANGDLLMGNYSVKAQCAEGADGAICSMCKENYFKRSKSCLSCPSSWLKYLAFIAGYGPNLASSTCYDSFL